MKIAARLAFAVCGVYLLAHAAMAQDACAAGDRAIAESRWNDANAAYGECVKVNPSFAVYSNMGMALSHMGRMEDAIGSYEKALKLDPSNSRVEFNLAVALIKAGNYSPAADHLKHLQRNGSDLRYDELLAFSYYHLGSYSLAARTAERVYAKQPDDPANALILGSAYTRMGQYEKAMPLITLALKAAGSAEGHLILAQTLIGMHHYPDAQTELNQVAAMQPDFPGLHEAMGEVLVGTEHAHDAEPEFEAALKQDPNDFEANYFLGRLKRFDGDYAAANRYLSVADALHPNSSEVANERAEIAMKEQRYKDAIPLLEQVIKADPDQAQAYLLLSVAYQRTGRREDAQREGELYNAKRKESHDQRASQSTTGEKP